MLALLAKVQADQHFLQLLFYPSPKETPFESHTKATRTLLDKVSPKLRTPSSTRLSSSLAQWRSPMKLWLVATWDKTQRGPRTEFQEAQPERLHTRSHTKNHHQRTALDESCQDTALLCDYSPVPHTESTHKRTSEWRGTHYPQQKGRHAHRLESTETTEKTEAFQQT